MRRELEVKYARTLDGTYVAYRVLGDGPPLLLVNPGFLPIDSMEDEPLLATALQRLASFSRLICFDRRGVGGSDPLPRDGLPRLEQWVEDAVAVLDAEACPRATVLGPADGGLVALMLAATHPDRVRGLVLINAYARYLANADHPAGADPDWMRNITTSVTTPDDPSAGFDLLGLIAPSVANDLRFRAWWDRVGRRGASPSTAQSFRRVIDDSDVRALLPTVVSPALVVQHRDAMDVPRSQGEYLARALPNATYVELEEADSLWWIRAEGGLLDRIERFITGQPPSAGSHRPYLTLMFTDIVDSTRMASELGDRDWTERFQGYLRDATIEVASARGDYVRDTGDGMLATFEGPVRAIRCAARLRERARLLGLETRAGLHAGEVEQRGRDVSGLSVHIAARAVDEAAEGEVLVTQNIMDLTSGAGIAFDDRGEYQLKGVPGTWRLFAATP